jgi:WSC domain/CFEM domain
MIGQATSLGCPTADPACLCQVTNFQNGMHDCSIGACGSAVGAYVLSFEAKWCAAALATATISTSTQTATSPGSTPTSISTLPNCGQTCFNNMLAQATALGCPGADPACLCQVTNFQNGMHDCSMGACGATVGAVVLAFEAKWCAAALATATNSISTQTATSPGSTPTSISTLPNCGQTCFNNMLAQATTLGCPGADPACLCQKADFQNGMHDCSIGACGATVGAAVLAFEAQWCAAASPSSTTTTSAIATPTSISDLPACGQTCFNNMLAQATTLGCPGADPACLCQKADFQNGIHDCSIGACGATVGAAVLAFEAQWCTAASSSSTTTATSPTTTSMIATSTSTSVPAAPTKVGGTFDYVGCFSSLDSFSSFHLQAIYPGGMTIDACAFQCTTVPDKYAGVWGSECYCSDTFNVTGVVMVPDADCNTPCPGDASEVCGGTIVGNTSGKRQAGSKLLTVYVNNGTVSNSTTSSSSSYSPAGSTSLTSQASSSAYSSAGTISLALPVASSSTSPQLSSSTSTRIPYPISNGTSTSVSFVSAQTTSYTLSTVYATSIYTITSCAPTVTNCPAIIGKVTTVIVSLYTTICPVTAPVALNPSTPTASNKALPIAYTTVVVTEYTAICPEGTLSVYTTSQTQTLYSVPGMVYTTTPAIAMTTVKATLVGGSSVVLTVPAQATATASSGKESSLAPPQAPVSSASYTPGNSTALATGNGKATASGTVMVTSGGGLGVEFGNAVVAFVVGLVGLFIL